VVASEAADGAGLDPTDLRTHLTGLATAAVHIAVPAEPVALPAHHALELAAAVSAALDNVHLCTPDRRPGRGFCSRMSGTRYGQHP